MADAAAVLTVPDLLAFKSEGRRITVLTCYDALFARLLDGHVDVLLVGDSLHQLLGGHETTLGATLDQMIYHGAAVARGATRSLVFVDLPFLTYQVTVADAVRNAGRVLQETGADGVKLEGGVSMRDTIAAIVRAGIPVMGHVGLTPQSVHQLGGYRVQGRGRTAAHRLLTDAKAVEEAGGCAVVLELVPAPLAGRVSRQLHIPTIGIGAGPNCDGQVLVLHDMLGLNEGFAPKFLKTYADLAPVVRKAAKSFSREVREGRYPTRAHSFE